MSILNPNPAGRGTWETTLQARDVNGDGIVEAYYDTAVNITWLANANAGAGSTFDNGLNPTDGRMTWVNANAWAAALNVQGVTGWRLPEMFSGSTTSSELSHMYCTTLGNFGPCNPLTTTGRGSWGFTNTGPFTNVVSEFTGRPRPLILRPRGCGLAIQYLLITAPNLSLRVTAPGRFTTAIYWPSLSQTLTR